MRGHDESRVEWSEGKGKEGEGRGFLVDKGGLTGALACVMYGGGEREHGRWERGEGERDKRGPGRKGRGIARRNRVRKGEKA